MGKPFSERVDDVIGVFSPKTALERARARTARQIMLGAYEGAKVDRLSGGWMGGTKSADNAILGDLVRLRDRSRELNRNDSFAAGITETVVSNDIATGIKPQSRIDFNAIGIPREAATLFQRQAEEVWRTWVPFADSQQMLDYYEMQEMIDRQMLESGDVIVIENRLPLKGRPFGLAYTLVEADRLETPPKLSNSKSNSIRGGVQYNSFGKPMYYHIRSTHPGDYQYSTGAPEYTAYPAFSKDGRPLIHHLFFKKRPGQSRGVPFFAPAMNIFKHVADYIETEIVTARVTACLSAFIYKEDPHAATVAGTDGTDASDNRKQYLEPGTMTRLGVNERIATLTPTRPGFQFDLFVMRMLKHICTSCNLPYEVVAKEFNASYSASRAAILEARRYFRIRQDWLTRKFNVHAYGNLLEEAYLRGQLDAPNFMQNKLRYCNARWSTIGWGWLDPDKEVKAAKAAIDARLSTHAKMAAELDGGDWEENFEQLDLEFTRAKELNISAVPKKIVSTTVVSSDGGAEGETGEPEEEGGTSETVTEKTQAEE